MNVAGIFFVVFNLYVGPFILILFLTFLFLRKKESLIKFYIPHVLAFLTSFLSLLGLYSCLDTSGTYEIFNLLFAICYTTFLVICGKYVFPKYPYLPPTRPNKPN